MRYPKRLLTDDEEIVREFRAHWKVLIPPTLVLLAAIAAAVLSYLYLGDDSTARWAGTAVGVLAILGLVIPPYLRWRYRIYVLTTERLIVREGIIRRRGTELSLESINNVLFSQGVIERLLWFGDVVIESAGSLGRSKLDDIPDPEAFQSQVYQAREQRTIQLKSAAYAGAPRDVAAQLSALADLRERGHLTDDEFEAKKAKLLGSA